jgi:hypothetical protein
MDAKQACDKLNGFNFQSRYLVGASNHDSPSPLCDISPNNVKY